IAVSSLAGRAIKSRSRPASQAYCGPVARMAPAASFPAAAKRADRIDKAGQNPYIPAPLPRAAGHDRLYRVCFGPAKAILLWSNAGFRVVVCSDFCEATAVGGLAIAEGWPSG